MKKRFNSRVREFVDENGIRMMHDFPDASINFITQINRFISKIDLYLHMIGLGFGAKATTDFPNSKFGFRFAGMMTNEKAVAEKLLQVNAVRLNPQQPFTWASGWKSPIYCDNRRTLGFPYIRDFIKSELCNLIFEQFPDAEWLGGVATAGIAWGAMAADQLKLPYIYIRPKPKEHGLENQIEGYFETGKRIVIVEDLVSTGKSSLQVCEVVEKAGLKVIGIVSIFTYGFDIASRLFADAGIPFYSLTNYERLINLAVEQGVISAEMEKTLLNWRTDPSNWKGI